MALTKTQRKAVKAIKVAVSKLGAVKRAKPRKTRKAKR